MILMLLIVVVVINSLLCRTSRCLVISLYYDNNHEPSISDARAHIGRQQSPNTPRDRRTLEYDRKCKEVVAYDDHAATEAAKSAVAEERRAYKFLLAIKDLDIDPSQNY